MQCLRINADNSTKVGKDYSVSVTIQRTAEGISLYLLLLDSCSCFIYSAGRNREV